MEERTPNIEEALQLFDEYNKQDPNKITWEQVEYPAEYFYALQVYNWVKKLKPGARDALLLASRAQHIGRWNAPRSQYPDGRLGYFRWRTDLAKFHAATATTLLQQAGVHPSIIEQVQPIILKEGIKRNEDVQTIENALCLVFLQFQFPAFVLQHEEAKVIKVLQKTWAKMSSPGHEAALALPYSEAEKDILKKALG